LTAIVVYVRHQLGSLQWRLSGFGA